MESFGHYLKSLREQKNKSLEEIAEATKIALTNLESLERDRYDLLPPLVFVKGFVRSYAQEVGIPPAEALEQFAALAGSKNIGDYQEAERVVFNKPPRGTIVSNPLFTIVLTFAGVISIGILLTTVFVRVIAPVFSKSGGKSAAVVSTAAPATGFDLSAGRGGSDSSGGIRLVNTGKADSSRKTLEISAIANAWVRVAPDNGPAEELIMSPGDRQKFTAKESFYVQTGNAGGIRMKLDGASRQIHGKMNQSLAISLP